MWKKFWLFGTENVILDEKEEKKTRNSNSSIDLLCDELQVTYPKFVHQLLSIFQILEHQFLGVLMLDHQLIYPSF